MKEIKKGKKGKNNNWQCKKRDNRVKEKEELQDAERKIKDKKKKNSY